LVLEKRALQGPKISRLVLEAGPFSINKNVGRVYDMNRY